MSFHANEQNSVWSKVPALAAELAKCIADKWGSGKTVELLSRIAGEPISRNAAIGYARRHGMSFAGGKSHKPKPIKRQVPYNITRPKAVEYVQLPEAPVPADFLGLTILDLPLNGCRYPAGEGPILFCGQPQHNGSSYCLFHKNICTTRMEGKSWFALRDLSSPTMPIQSKPPQMP